MTQDIVHRLVGYDRTTDRIAFQRDIPLGKLEIVKRIAHVEETDPEALGAYELSREEARDVAGILDIALPGNMHFFLEPFAAIPA